MDNTFKYFAFISYNSKDTAWGKKLQKKLEHYRMPATLCSERGWKRKPISPVFFAPTDIQPGGLSEELQERLKASQNLIVICSPNSAKSKWVGREIEFFHKLGRTKNIHFFIVEGTPHSGNPDTECFNPVVDTLGLPEILGANIHEKVSPYPWINKERAYVQLISKLLGVEFDSIWQRHKRRLIRNIALWTIGIIAVVAALIFVWRTNQPFDTKISLNEASVHNDQLPSFDSAVLKISLDNEEKIGKLLNLEEGFVFNNIPHRFLNKEVHVTLTTYPQFIFEDSTQVLTQFYSVDTIMTLTPEVTLNIYRNPAYYGDIHFLMFNPNEETFITNETVFIEGCETRSDDDGRVVYFMPLESQKEAYQVTAPAYQLENPIITMPCGDDNAILSR